MAEDRRGVKIKEDGLGEVQIAEEVITIIAGLAATEVEGVCSMGGNITKELVSRLGMKNLSKGEVEYIRRGAMPKWDLSDLTPLLSATTIFPGRISRSKLAPTASSPQLSEANTTLPSFSLPMRRGRKPWGARTAISLLGDEMTREYAPTRRSMAAETASSMELCFSRSCTMM